jgi:hypothetical protein
MKTLRKKYKMPLYVATNIAIKPNLQSLTKLANANGNNDLENDNFEQNFHLHNSNKFEEIIEESCGKTLVQNILNPKQIIDDDLRILTVASREGFWPLGLFLDPYSKE